MSDDKWVSAHTEKFICPVCQEPVKVPAGQDRRDFHKHSKPKAEPQARSAASARSQTIKKGTN